MEPICDDLVAEHDALDAIVADLADDATGWDHPTPAPEWSIRDQISHLWFFDQRALLALTDADGFAADAATLLAGGGTDASVVPGREMSAADLLAAWRRDRGALVAHARTVDPATRVPWYGPAMGARSFITARLMETWAHGVDVADSLGRPIVTTDRLRHVAHIGVRARPFSYAIRRMEVPAVDVHVALSMPDGSTMVWGDPSSDDVVSGPALDFCLVVTQRRHPADVALDVRGVAAHEWIGIAQAFAGAPGAGRRPGQFATG
jgi:uncharacterized protein (TIGR03084 family)